MFINSDTRSSTASSGVARSRPAERGGIHAKKPDYRDHILQTVRLGIESWLDGARALDDLC